jgi:transposase
MTDEALSTLSRQFEQVYSDFGRPSIPPEQLLRALLLQVLYTIRSERLLMEQLAYNLLFRWFVGLGLDEPVWDHSTFSKNRDRLLDGDLAGAFFQAVRAQADAAHLLSDEHFTVDGTLLDAWASHKSLRRRDDAAPPSSDDDPKNPTVNFRGERRSNRTHRSTTDPEARLYRKSDGAAARLAYLGHVVAENRFGLIVEAEVTWATGVGERDAAVAMLRHLPRCDRSTIAGDKYFDTRGFVTSVRSLGLTPHVAQTTDVRRRSAIDRRTTRHPGYRLSQQKRKLVEQAFGWMKTIGGMRKLHHRGTALVRWMFTFNAAAYNLVRIRSLLAARA